VRHGQHPALFCRPGDGPAKGKVERVWRTLREGLLDRIDARQVTTLDELNLRLWSYVEGEYHHRAHSSLAGRTPLEAWEAGAADIRWVSDPAWLEAAFHAHIERKARNDSTVLWRGVSYEVPSYLRGRTVRLRYSLLDPGRVSVLDGSTEIPLRPVDTIANAHRSRDVAPPPPPSPKPSTGLNAPDLMLNRFLRPPSPQPDDDPDPEGGRHE